MKTCLQPRTSPSTAHELRKDLRTRHASKALANRMSAFDNDAPRMDVVARVRAEIAAGTYDTDDRFDAALDRFFESLVSRRS